MKQNKKSSHKKVLPLAMAAIIGCAVMGGTALAQGDLTAAAATIITAPEVVDSNIKRILIQDGNKVYVYVGVLGGDKDTRVMGLGGETNLQGRGGRRGRAH